jgi:hypothetical protein
MGWKAEYFASFSQRFITLYANSYLKARKSLPVTLLFINRLLKKWFFQGCSKMPRCKAPEILRSEAYLQVRCNDEG